MAKLLESSELADWKLALERILRFRPHTLGKSEEQLLAMQGQMSEASNQIFRQLNDADLTWPALPAKPWGACSAKGAAKPAAPRACSHG